MMTDRKTFHFVFLSAVALALASVAIRAEVIEQVLVKINGEIFTKTDLETRQVAALRQLGQQVDPKSNPSDAQLRKMLDDVTPQLLVSVIDEIRLVQRARLGYIERNLSIVGIEGPDRKEDSRRR
jgi:hypothetical protein